MEQVEAGVAAPVEEPRPPLRLGVAPAEPWGRPCPRPWPRPCPGLGVRDVRAGAGVSLARAVVLRGRSTEVVVSPPRPPDDHGRGCCSAVAPLTPPGGAWMAVATLEALVDDDTLFSSSSPAALFSSPRQGGAGGGEGEGGCGDRAARALAYCLGMSLGTRSLTVCARCFLWTGDSLLCRPQSSEAGTERYESSGRSGGGCARMMDSHALEDA